MRTFTLVLILVLSALAAGDVDTINGLKGIQSVSVVVNAFTPEQIRYGLNPVEISDRIAKTLENYNITPVFAAKIKRTIDKVWEA